jgi:hypothetical protein
MIRECAMFSMVWWSQQGRWKYLDLVVIEDLLRLINHCSFLVGCKDAGAVEVCKDLEDSDGLFDICHNAYPMDL